MKYSKKKYLDYMIRTIEALHNSNNSIHTFINNPGFGNIFDILNNEEYNLKYVDALVKYAGNDYADAIITSLKKSSLNSYYTPPSLIKAISGYLNSIKDFKPKEILEPSAGNGLIIREIFKTFPKSKITAFEKDILTTRILEHNFKNSTDIKVYGIPFENINSTDATKKYDLVVSNIPFGANKVFDPELLTHPLRHLVANNIHSYFIYKSLNVLKPKGMAVLIATKNFMDKKKYSSLREHLIKTNNFLGGIRLPQNAFEHENTAVVTDILVFQNNKSLQLSNEQKRINNLFINTIIANVADNEVQLSSYFNEHRNNIIGELIPGGLYDNKDYTVTNPHNITRFEFTIKDLLKSFAPTFKITKKTLKTKSISQKAIPNTPQQTYTGNLKSGNLFISNQKIAKVTASNEYYYLNTKPTDYDKLTKIISLRDTYFKLLDTNVKDGQKILDDLNYQYDVFNFQYGNLNDKLNVHLITIDIQGPLVLSLETPKNGIFKKSKILIEPWKSKNKITENLSLKDAIYYSLNKHNKIEINLIAELSNKTSDEVITESLNNSLLFLNPTENNVELVPKYLFYPKL